MKFSYLALITLFTYPSILLSSCSSYPASKTFLNYSYSDVLKFQISYESLLKMKDFEYFAYIYSANCLHCESIKNEVISFALEEKYPMYFITYTLDIPVLQHIESTINQNTLDKVGILGTPSLIQIIDGHVKLNVCGGDIITSILSTY